MGYTDAVTDVAMREKMLKIKIDPLTLSYLNEKLNITRPQMHIQEWNPRLVW